MLDKRSVRLMLLGTGAVLVAVVLAWVLSAALAPKSPPVALPTPPPPAILPLGSPTTSPHAPTSPGGGGGDPTAGGPTAGGPTAGGPTAGGHTAGGSTAGGRAAGRPGTSATPPAAGKALSATLTVTAAWDDGYVTEIEVVNSGGTALPWTVTVSNASRFDVRLGNTWNATATQDGDTIVLRGQPLPAGRTITAGYQVSAAAASRPRPAACTLTGGPCRLA